MKCSVVHNNQGGGNVYAKLIDKKEVETTKYEELWNGRVILPFESDKNLLPYDSINTKLSFTKDDTNKCINGCELYINIVNSEKLRSYIDKLINKLSLYLTVDKNDIIDCQLSEYVYGQISTKDQYSFYKIAIPFDTDRIMINFDTFHDTMYINTDIKPTQESFQWTLSKENETFIITASELKVESLKGVIFIIGITNHKDYNDSYFKF